MPKFIGFIPRFPRFLIASSDSSQPVSFFVKSDCSSGIGSVFSIPIVSFLTTISC